MTVNKKILEALKPFGMPVVPNHYNGNEKRYIEFDLYDDKGTCFCDDYPEVDIVTVQVHLFLPMEENYLSLKKQIRKALYDVGFAYADITELAEPEATSQYPKGIRHLTFETDIDED